MAQLNQFNLGRAVQTGQQIQYNEMRNQVTGMQLQAAQDTLRNRQKAQQIRQQYKEMPAQIEALERQGLYDEADKMRSHYIDVHMNEIKMIDGLRHSIDGTNYDQFRQDMIQSGALLASMMPVEYSDDWWRKEVEKKRGNLTKLTRKWGDEGAVFAQDMIQRDGSIVWAGDPYDPNKPKTGSGAGGSGGGKGGAQGGGKPFEIQASDSNSIRSHVRSMFGSYYNPATGEFNALNRKTENDVAAIQGEAARIFRQSEGRLSHAEAVNRAARKLQIQIRDLEKDPMGTDPLGIR